VYDASVAIHVAAALVGFGATFSYPVLQLLGERGDRRHLAFALAAIAAISRYVAVPATLVVGATGIFQVADGPYSLHDRWVVLGLALYLGVMAVAIGFLAPRYRRAGAAAAAGDATAYRTAIRGVTVVGPLVALAVLAIVFLMELKPA
jgi:uncharacterized membrane protein